MTTTNYNITTKISWAKVFESNRDMEGYKGNAVATEGQYQVTVELDRSQRQLLKTAGSAVDIKFDIDGNATATLRRPHKHARFDWAGGEPKVTKPDGTPWLLAEDGFINNGSLAEVGFSVYTTSGTNGTRLEYIKVLEHAEREERTPEPPEPPKPVSNGKGEEEIPF
jgi:hypothetical protein